MALTLTCTIKGVTANYHKIILTEENFKTDTTKVTVATYKDSAARTASVNNDLQLRTFILDSSDLTRAGMYTALKALPQFDGAQDE